MRILYKLTTRSRPELAKRAIQSVIDNSVSDDFEIWVTLDHNDEATIDEIENLEKTYNEKYNRWVISHCVTLVNKCTKISAINRDLEEIKILKWDILVNLSDDQVFVKKGFDEDIRNAFADNLDQFIHFPDGNRKDLCTMSIIGYPYFMRDNYIYYPEYITECCDDEAQEVAKLRGCYKFVDIEIFNHLHPAYNKAEWDRNYADNLTLDKQSHDRDLLAKRRAINFGL